MDSGRLRQVREGGSSPSRHTWHAPLCHLHHLSAQRTVVASAQDRALHNGHHDPVDQGRDSLSVSTFLTCILSLMCPEMFSASLLLPDSLDCIRISRIYDHLGPTPRLCLECLSDSDLLREYECDLQTTVLTVTADRLKNLIREATSLTLDAVSHRICLISHEKQDDMHRLLLLLLLLLSSLTKSAYTDTLQRPLD